MTKTSSQRAARCGSIYEAARVSGGTEVGVSRKGHQSCPQGRACRRPRRGAPSPCALSLGEAGRGAWPSVLSLTVLSFLSTGRAQDTRATGPGDLRVQKEGPATPAEVVSRPARGTASGGCSEPIGQPGSGARSRPVPACSGRAPGTFGKLVNPGGFGAFPGLGAGRVAAPTWGGLRDGGMRRLVWGPAGVCRGCRRGHRC